MRLSDEQENLVKKNVHYHDNLLIISFSPDEDKSDEPWTEPHVLKTLFEFAMKIKARVVPRGKTVKAVVITTLKVSTMMFHRVYGEGHYDLKIETRDDVTKEMLGFSTLKVRNDELTYFEMERLPY